MGKIIYEAPLRNRYHVIEYTNFDWLGDAAEKRTIDTYATVEAAKIAADTHKALFPNSRCVVVDMADETTTRQTTLGALTAADLGKRVKIGEDEGTLTGVLHDNTGWSATRFGTMPSTTPVTVYDKEADDDR